MKHQGKKVEKKKTVMMEEVREEHIYESPKKHREDQNEEQALWAPPSIKYRRQNYMTKKRREKQDQ